MSTVLVMCVREHPPVRLVIIAWAFCAWTVAGCGSSSPSDRLPTFTVKGQVLWNGKPAAGARVVLSPSDAALKSAKWTHGFPHASVGDDGTCVFSTYGERDGAPAGDYVVLIQKLVPANPDAGDDDEAQQVDVFNGQYSKPETSPWKVTVSQGPTELRPIELAKP
jgi:hypothetical protein